MSKVNENIRFKLFFANSSAIVDFLTSVKDKICPLEVKSGNYRTHKSLDAFCNKFSNRIGSKYVVHTKDYKWENGIYYIPMYMVPFL